MENQQVYQNIIIIVQAKKVYLSNQLSEPIERLVYETFSMVTSDEVIGVSSTPTYEILNIPANSAVFLEQLDGWEDGRIYYNLLKVKSESIDFEGRFSFKQKSLSGMFPLSNIVAIEKTKLETTAGFVVDLDDKIINSLYWFAEDLVAYTDLKGERFDIEKAQLRLWKMNPHLLKLNNTELTKLYQQLDEQLENANFFDKIAFSEILNKLFSLLGMAKK